MTTYESRPSQAAARHEPTTPARAGRWLAVTRIAMGFTFLWAFLDKAFGLGYSTSAEQAWVNGGSPTKGFLANVDVGPLASLFHDWAGTGPADWLFMLGLLGVGAATFLGIGLRPAAVAGTAMMLLMWAAQWPPATTTAAGEPSLSTNPVVDYHVVYALVLITLAATSAGRTWGFGRVWSEFGLVRRNRWLI